MGSLREKGSWAKGLVFKWCDGGGGGDLGQVMVFCPCIEIWLGVERDELYDRSESDVLTKKQESGVVRLGRFVFYDRMKETCYVESEVEEARKS